jgi:hypothetical protein
VLLIAVPAGVLTDTLPDVTLESGTLVARLVVVDEDPIAPRLTLIVRLSFVMTGSKLVPETLKLVPATPIDGVSPVIVGTPEFTTVKGLLEVAVPAGAVTEIVPVVAVAGTVATNCVGLADVTVAATPLNFTVF